MNIDKEPPPSPDSSLNGFVKMLKDAEERYRYWITVAKELKISNAELSQSLATQHSLNSSLNSELSTLSNDYDTLKSSHNALVASKETLESNITDLTDTVKTATDMIGTTVNKLKKLEDERNALAARIETLQFDLTAADDLVEALQEELVKLRDVHANDIDSFKLASEENERQAMKFKDLNTDEKTSASTSDQIQSLQASIDRLQRKYDRLVTKKETAEQRFYASYVDWHNFKGWWAGFSKFPGVSRRMLTYNREVKSGTWIPGGRQALGVGGKGTVLKVIEVAEQDPKAFPNVVEEEEELAMETDQEVDLREKLEDGSGMEDPTQKLERVCREAQEICGPTTTLAGVQGDPKLIPYQYSPKGGDATLVTSAQELVADKEDEGGAGQGGSFDPDKTQETTPAKSQAPPFKLDLSGLKQPRIDLYSPAIRPILERPRLLSPEPSQVIVIKDESQDPDTLLQPMSTTTISPAPLASTSKSRPLATTIKSSKPITTPITNKPTAFAGPTPVAPLPSAPPSTLGKRKAPMEEQTPVAEGSRHTARVPLQLQYMDGTAVPTTNSSTKRRWGLDDDDEMESPSVRTVAGKGKFIANEGDGKKSDKLGGASTTLNGLYEINPARNGGLNFAYHDSERNKAARKKMDAGSCADCIEYYRVIGPMPPRAQPPLWKSPTSTPHAAKTSRPGCKCSTDRGRGAAEEAGEDDFTAHQQQISRHRYHFPPPQTPPMYWDIGFPDTQQVKEIKETAERMHERKERGMEMEARKPDGKYRRR